MTDRNVLLRTKPLSVRTIKQIERLGWTKFEKKIQQQRAVETLFQFTVSVISNIADG